MKLFDYFKNRKAKEQSLAKLTAKTQIEKVEATLKKSLRNTDLFQDDSDLGYC